MENHPLQDHRTLESGCCANEWWLFFTQPGQGANVAGWYVRGSTSSKSCHHLLAWSRATTWKAKEYLWGHRILLQDAALPSCFAVLFSKITSPKHGQLAILSMQCLQWEYQACVWHPKMFVSRLIYTQFSPTPVLAGNYNSPDNFYIILY